MPPALAFRDLGVLTESTELAAVGLSLSPPPHGLAAALGAADAYEFAVRGRGAQPQVTATIVLAHARMSLTWDDVGPGARLVYLLRWDGVTMASHGPALWDGRRRPPVVGTRTVVVDAHSGALLLETLSTGNSDATPRVDPFDGKLARWANRSEMDPRVRAKVPGLVNWAARDVVEACSSSSGAHLAVLLTEIGGHLGQRLRALDEAIGPFLHSRELAALAADLEWAITVAQHALGRPLPMANTVLLQAVTTALGHGDLRGTTNIV